LQQAVQQDNTSHSEGSARTCLTDQERTTGTVRIPLVFGSGFKQVKQNHAMSRSLEGCADVDEHTFNQWSNKLCWQAFGKSFGMGKESPCTV
jgi:uncharacterized protein YhfF